jgi:hypothetical protein
MLVPFYKINGKRARYFNVKGDLVKCDTQSIHLTARDFRRGINLFIEMVRK